MKFSISLYQQVQTQPSSEEALNLSCRGNLLSNLLQLLNTADLSEFEKREEKYDIYLFESLQSLTVCIFYFSYTDVDAVYNHKQTGLENLMKSSS